MKDVKRVEILFENCESVDFDPKDFYRLSLENISTSIHRIACNSISKVNVSNHISFILTKLSNNENYFPFGIKEHKTSIFDRIRNWKDITSICLTYEDETKETYYANWTGDNDYENESQFSYITSEGNLIVVIDSDYKSIDQYMKNHNTSYEEVDEGCSFYNYMELDDESYLNRS